MPKVSVSNQERKENFLRMLIAPTAAELPGRNRLLRAANIEYEPYQPTKGFITQLQDPLIQWVLEKMRVEMDRLTTLTDIRIMLEEAPYIDGTCNKFCLWATVGKPQLSFVGGTATRAQRVVNDMLERIQYMSRRGDYIYNGLFLEAFLKKQISFIKGLENGKPEKIYREFMRGMAIGRIEDILGPLPPETIFRNSNKQDSFDNPSQAFFQVPEGYYNPSIMAQAQREKEWFHNMLILHPRWNHRRQKSHRYSRPALKPVRKAYNRTELSATDAVIQRHLAASRLLVIYLAKNVGNSEDVGVSLDELENFRTKFINEHASGFNKPGTVYITSGENEVNSVGDLNLTLSKPSDIYLHFDFMSVGLLLHPVLAGFMGSEGRAVSGPLLEQLRNNLAMDLEAVNLWEDREILKPLCYFELFLNGIFDTEINVLHDQPAFIKNIERKVMMSEVQMKALSRQTYYESTGRTERTWEEEKKIIMQEDKDLGAAKPTENINKGASGSNRDSADTPVQGEE